MASQDVARAAFDPLGNPDGFRQTNSGIIVPEGWSRDREAFSDEDVRLILRTTTLVNRRGWFLTLTCPHVRCGGSGKPVVRRVEVPGGFELQCEHKTIACLHPIARRR